MRIAGLSLEDFAINICDYLIKNKIDVVLSGGACVSIYTQNKYMSFDLDFVLISNEKQREIQGLLIDIGFFNDGMFFRHKDSEYFLHFVSPPLSIGDEPVKKIGQINRGGRKLCLLSPTDCVKDRLSAYYYWDDRQALEQAILVAKDHRINLSEIRRWSIKERQLEKHKRFVALLGKKNKGS